MADLIAINKKYEKIFKILDIILILAVFSPNVLIIISIFYHPNFYLDFVSEIFPIFSIIFLFILIFSIFFIIKGKTKQVKDLAGITLGKSMIFVAISLTINFIIMISFNYFNWVYAVVLLFGGVSLIYFIYETYVFKGMFNLKFRKARKLRFKGNYGDALILFNELENEGYDYPSLYFNLGFIYKDEKEYDKALEYFDKLLNLEDNLKYEHEKELCTYSYEHKAYILRELKRYDESLETINKALKHRDDYDWSWNEKGYLLYVLGKYEESLHFFDKAIELNFTNEDAHYYKANALIKLERYEEAIDKADDLLNINSNNTLALNIKIRACILAKNYFEALDYVEKSLQIDSKDYITLFTKGYILFILSRYQKSLISFKKSLKINNNGETLNYIGLCFEEMEKHDEAKKYYNKSLSYYNNLLKEDGEDK